MEDEEAGLSCPVTFSLDGLSLVGEVTGRLGDVGVCDLAGLSGEGAGLGAVGAGLLMDAAAADDDEDNDEGVDKHAAGRAENDDGILRPSLASSSLHTAKLRLPPSRPAVSEHLALS